MNEIVNKFSLAGDKCMPEMHLKQPGFTYSVCGLFTENKERIPQCCQYSFSKIFKARQIILEPCRNLRKVRFENA